MRHVTPLVLIALMVASDASAGDRRTPEARAAVRNSIERAFKATSQEQQQSAFDEIVALGCPAVPEIIAAMDDSRPLPVAYIRLQNDDPHAFEAFRQYGPRSMTDALAAILNHLTWQDFGFIYNGVTEQERKRAIAGWRAFLRDTPTRELCAPKQRGG
jgi:hypothetical protein